MGGMHVPYGMEILHVHYDTCFRENIEQNMFISFEIFPPYGMYYLHLMRTLEEKFMEGWIGEHLDYEGSLSHVGVTDGGRKELQHSSCQLLEDKQHLVREDYNIPKFSWNIQFCFIALFKE